MTEVITKEKALEVIKKYTERKETSNKPFNIFEIVKMRETSHTKFLAWLLDVKNKNIDSIQFQFIKNFLKKIELEVNNINEFVKLLSKDLKVIPEFTTALGNIDIFLYSENAKFVCVIENKIDAKICINKGRTQIERYWSFVNSDDNYKNFNNKKFVFITSYADTLKKVNEKLLQRYQYKIIEQSDVAEIINDDVLKSGSEEGFIKEIVKEYKDYWEHNWYETEDGIWIVKACEALKEYPEEIENMSKGMQDTFYNFLKS